VRRYRTERRSPARATLLIVGGLIVGVAVLVAVLVSLGGGSKGGSSSTGTTAESTSGGSEKSISQGTKTSSTSSKPAAGAAKPGETNVVVLNGTSTNGLAHRVSSELSGHGYSRASPLTGHPPGTNPVTVVEYANGHKADAQGVARTLGVTQAQPMEGTVSSLVGSATVVVIVGLDKAATSP
jgi:hypothetical protein